MTNAEKYLKDGVSRQFLTNFSRWYYSKTREIKNVDTVLAEFLAERVQPTLTEVERVILRNMQNNWKYIGRYEYDDTWAFSEMLYISTVETKESKNETARLELSQFNHLFQFIKEGEEYEIAELLKGE